MDKSLSDKEVKELIKIANGGSFFIHYNLEEQLEAIKGLGQSRNQKALNYVRRLNETKFEPSNPIEVMDESCLKYNPHAKGELYSALNYFLDEYGCLVADSKNEGPCDKSKRILSEALSRLEEAVGQNSYSSLTPLAQ